MFARGYIPKICQDIWYPFQASNGPGSHSRQGRSSRCWDCATASASYSAPSPAAHRTWKWVVGELGKEPWEIVPLCLSISISISIYIYIYNIYIYIYLYLYLSIFIYIYTVIWMGIPYINYYFKWEHWTKWDGFSRWILGEWSNIMVYLHRTSRSWVQNPGVSYLLRRMQLNRPEPCSTITVCYG